MYINQRRMTSIDAGSAANVLKDIVDFLKQGLIHESETEVEELEVSRQDCITGVRRIGTLLEV